MTIEKAGNQTFLLEVCFLPRTFKISLNKTNISKNCNSVLYIQRVPIFPNGGTERTGSNCHLTKIIFWDSLIFFKMHGQE